MMKRHSKNPIITRRDINSDLLELQDVSSIFNPGAVVFEDKILLLLRVQNRGRETLLVKAVSENGVDFIIEDHPIIIKGLDPELTDLAKSSWEKIPPSKFEIYHVYDPRITKLEGKYYVICAIDTSIGCLLGQFITESFEELIFQGFVSEIDVRNGVLFPEKINGKYYRLERPNQVNLLNGPKSGSNITVSCSNDLLHWEGISNLFSGRPHYWDELIGSGPPPLKTKYGWLHIYHGVATHFSSSNIYQAGISFLDLNNPEIVLKRGKYNILEPREIYELTGQVPNVVFPSGMIARTYDEAGFVKNDSEILIYYGAADTCIGLVTTTPEELNNLCRE